MTCRLFNILAVASLNLVGVLAGLAAEPARFARGQISALDVLVAYEQTLAREQVWAMDVRTTMVVESSRVDPWGEGIRGQQNRVRYYRDGDRRDVDTIEFGRFDGSGNKVQNPNAGLHCRAIADGWYVYSETDAAGSVLKATASLDGPRHRADALACLGRAQVLEAYAGDRKHIAELARGADDLRVVAEQDVVDGRPCVVLAWRCDCGSFTVWFDPASGYQPGKIVVEKGREHYYAGVRISRYYGLLPPGSSHTVSLNSVRYEMDGVRFTAIGGHDFPVACRVREVKRFSDGNVQTLCTECVRSNVELAPAFEAERAFTPRLRDGASLSNLDDRTTPLIWHSGGPVPRPKPARSTHAE